MSCRLIYDTNLSIDIVGEPTISFAFPSHLLSSQPLNGEQRGGRGRRESAVEGIESNAQKPSMLTFNGEDSLFARAGTPHSRSVPRQTKAGLPNNRGRKFVFFPLLPFIRTEHSIAALNASLMLFA